MTDINGFESLNEKIHESIPKVVINPELVESNGTDDELTKGTVMLRGAGSLPEILGVSEAAQYIRQRNENISRQYKIALSLFPRRR